MTSYLPARTRYANCPSKGLIIFITYASREHSKISRALHISFRFGPSGSLFRFYPRTQDLLEIIVTLIIRIRLDASDASRART